MESGGTFEYTFNMESIFQDKFSELKSYYCREDFEQALYDVQTARSDARKFRLNDLKRLCRARDMRAEELLENPALLENIPTRAQIQEELLQTFYDMYARFPKTTDFMERIVRRLAPEYREDTVRTAILKKFLAGAGKGFKRFRTGQILEWGKRRLNREEETGFSSLSEEEQQALIFSRIDDSIFENKTASLSAEDIFRLIAGRMEKYREDESLAFSEPELCRETLELLDAFMKQHSISGEDASVYEKIQSVERALEQGAVLPDVCGEELAGLTVKLEADFRNQLKTIPRVTKTGAAGNAAELYRQARKDALKAVRAKAKKEAPDYELLELCSDLAAGNFRVNGKTKVYLYYFAFMFGMHMPVNDMVYEHDKSRLRYFRENPDRVQTEDVKRKEEEYRRQLNALTDGKQPEFTADQLNSYSRDRLYLLRRALHGIMGCGELLNTADQPGAETIRKALREVQAAIDIKNIEKSLFQDFYNDNLLRFLEGDYTDPGAASAFEKEPTGEGINYKSFVEAVYLYFICHDELAMTPGEKIDAAEAVIEKCIRLAKRAGSSRKMIVSEHTQEYRSRHINILLNKKIEEIPAYIAANYVVISPENVGAARIMVASEENTAFDLIGEIMEELDAVYPEVELFDRQKKRELTKEMREEISARTDPVPGGKLKELLKERFAEDKDFLKVVDVIDERMQVNSGRYSKSERLRMIVLLHVLAVYSDETQPLSVYRIQSRMEEKGILSLGTQFGSAMAALKEIGYDICRVGEYYYLGARVYEESYLNDLLDRVSGRYLIVTEQTEIMMAELLIRRLRFDKRVTRSELIALHFHYYIALLNETEGLDTFPDIFEDYDATISPILEEARYQPLSEKNIFDMYIVTALYFYMVENNGYMGW